MRRAPILLAAILLASAGVVLPRQVSAASNDVQITAETVLQTTSNTIIAESGANVASLAVSGANIVVGLENGSSITLRSDEKLVLTASPAIATYTCGTNSSSITLTGTSAQTITVTVGQGCGAGSSSSSSGGGGGGGGQSYGGGLGAPAAAAVVINGGADTAASQTVALRLTAENVSQMLVGNTASFTDLASWVPYATSTPWTLSPGSGVKTVFAKFRSSGGSVSAVVSDTITLLAGYAPAPTPAVPLVTPTLPAPTPLLAPGPEAQLVKEAGKPAVWLIESGRRRVFRNADIFLAHGFQWAQVRMVGSLSDMPPGDPMDYPAVAGMLVKGSDAKVYLIQGGQRRWITSEQVFLGLGYQWSQIRVLFDATLGNLPEGDKISQAQAHVDGTLVKYAGNPKVYVIDRGRKRWVASEQAFRQGGYRWENILEIPDSFVYADGPTVAAAPPSSGQVLGTSTAAVFTAYLYAGSTGDEVLALQQLLAVRGFFPNDVAPNGRFGPTTVASVKRLQAVHRLPVTGTVGPLTRAVLNQLAGQESE